MIWLIACLLSLLFFAITNLLDSYFANNLFKSTHSLVFYFSLFNVIFLPLICLYELPTLPTWNMVPYLLLLGFTNVAYLYPWYKALQSGEVSIVASLWALGKLFIPILAFLFVNETLGLSQYIGFGVIVLASALLSYEPGSLRRFKFNKSLWWMTLCSFIVACEVVLYRYIFTTMSWSSGFVWSFVASLFFILPLLLFPKIRTQIKEDYAPFKSHLGPILIEEFSTFLAMSLVTFAISLQKVSIVETVMSFEPIVLIFTSYMWGKFLSKQKKFHLDTTQIAWRITLFGIMGLGVYLTFM